MAEETKSEGAEQTSADPAAETVAFTPEDLDAQDGIDLTAGDETDGAEAPAEPTDDERVAAAEDRALRLQAEMQNLLNRTRREVADERKYGALSLARDLLPALDNIDRALEAAAKEGDQSGGLADGFRLVREQIVGVLAQHGCEPIPTDPGVEFNPDLHEAILQQPSDDIPAGAVMMAAQSGYKLHDRVVRAAQVIVSSGPAEG